MAGDTLATSVPKVSEGEACNCCSYIPVLNLWQDLEI